MKIEDIVLTVVIPCYNEKDNITTIVKKVMESPVPNKEIIVVNDKSTDGSDKILEEQIKPMGIKIVHHKENQGKGAALRTGFKHATGDFVIIQDADQEYDPMEYPQILEPLIAGETQVVYGSRFLNAKAKGYKANQIANKFLTFLSNCFTHEHLTDMETCYKCFAREVIQSINIQENRFGFEPEITAKIAHKKIKIKEVPISYYPRTNEEGKKIGIKDGIRAIICIFKYH